MTVIQRADGTLTLGRNEHNHPGQEGALLAAKITARAKKDALDDLFKPAMVIVEPSVNGRDDRCSMSKSYPSL